MPLGCRAHRVACSHALILRVHAGRRHGHSAPTAAATGGSESVAGSDYHRIAPRALFGGDQSRFGRRGRATSAVRGERVGAHNSVVGADHGFRAPSWDQNRYEIRDTRTQHRPPSRQVNDHGRISGTHRDRCWDPSTSMTASGWPGAANSRSHRRLPISSASDTRAASLSVVWFRHRIRRGRQRGTQPTPHRLPVGIALQFASTGRAGLNQCSTRSIASVQGWARV